MTHLDHNTDAFRGLDYRSSGHDLASAGESARFYHWTLKAVRAACRSRGLDAEQTDIVICAFLGE